MESILSVSSRTVHKILKRSNIGCAICGWKEAGCDLHHIIEVSQHGTDDMDNLIHVCPNCHRMIHTHGDTFKTIEQLKEISLIHQLPNWKEFYQIHSKNTTTKFSRVCKCCGVSTNSKRFYCSDSCKNKASLNRKVDWTSDNIVEALTQFNGNLTKCGEHFGVSDNAFKKQCVKFSIDISLYRTSYKRKANYDITIS